MPQKFRKAVITNEGIKMIASAIEGGSEQQIFTRLVIGNGVYTEKEKSSENLQKMTALKSEKNSYTFSGKSIENEHSVKVTALITNQDPITKEILISEGYYINEMGIYAKVGEGEEVLYSIVVIDGDVGEYMPAFENYPTEIIQDYYITVGNGNDITVIRTGAALLASLISDWALQPEKPTYSKEEVGLGNADDTADIDKPVSTAQQKAIDLAYTNANGYTDQKIDDLINGAPEAMNTLGEIADVVNQEKADLNNHVGNDKIHITDEERSKWNNKLDKSAISDWALQPTKPTYSKTEVGLGNADNTADINKPVSTAQQNAIDLAYGNANAYTDQKIADLINGAPSTLDTLGEIATAMAKEESVVDALNEAIGKKANQTELDTHTGNSTIHITASEREKWNESINDKTPTFSVASTRANIASGEKISVILGKIMKFFADMKTVAFSGSYTDLTNKPSIPAAVAVKGNAESSYRTGNVNLTPANLGALSTSGDSKSNTVTFSSGDASDSSVTKSTGWTTVTALASGITHATFFQRVSQMFKNVRYLYKLIGTTDISAIGDGTVKGAISTLNSNLLEKVYPVGAVYISVVNTSPEDLFGGTWVAITAGYYLKSITSGTGGTYSAATNVGNTTLTVNQMPAHTHSISNNNYQVGDSGGGGSWGYAINNAGGGNVTGNALVAQSTGGGQSHTHSMGTPATMTVYMWKRIA